MDNRDRLAPPRLAIVVPCYNEQEVFEQTDATLRQLLCRMAYHGEISAGSFVVYVDDGSADATWHLIEESVMEYPGTDRGVKLGHNSGHQNALLAGVEAALPYCDAAITIDADLQDDVEAIPRMVEEYRRGCEVVYGVRENRQTDSGFKRRSAEGFYKTMHRLGVETVFNHADFRLMSARALHELLRYKEDNIFLRGIVPRIGLRQGVVKYDRKPRRAGESKYPLKKMLNFAIEGITSFSIRPVRMVFTIGVIFLLITLAIFIYTLCRYFTNQVIEGWTSLMLSIWFCTGVLLVSLGIIGEYVGKVFIEVKNRPRYVIETTKGF